MKGEKLERFNELVDKINENAPKEIIKTELKCPKCGEGYIQLEINKDDEKKKYLKCSNDSCNWNGGKTFIEKEDLENVELCPSCDGLLVPRKAKNGSKFKGCINFPKCRETKPMDDEENHETKSNFIPNEIIETKLKCPKCGNTVIVEINKKFDSKYFKCLNKSCNWSGGKFNQDLKYLDHIENCPKCDGILYPRKGKKGLFLGCSNFPKCRETKFFNENSSTKSNVNSSKSSYSNKSNKSVSKYEAIETKLDCPICGNGKVTLLKNKENGKGFFKCSNDSCDYDGGPFNQDTSLLKTLAYCTAPGCNGLTYLKNGKYGPFKVCTYFVKTKCNAGRK